MTDALTFITSLRWQDFADIGLNGYILFRLYVLFRGSRLIRVIGVLILLWLFKGLALYTGLVVTSWAIQGIIAAAALILIIVFRDEIASVFQAKQLKTFLWGFPARQEITPMEIISRSAFEMGRSKVGALMVVPDGKGVDDIVQGGIEWDGKLSREMLLSIFWDKNPVHDGAVIIKGDRISHVGVILPLSRRRDLPSRFGTRHRAAIGLAEHSSALIITVSEESGHITVVKGNEIKNVRNTVHLKSIIEGHVGKGKKRDTAQWKDWMEYGSAALVCLVLVTGIWFGLSRGRETLKTMEVPLEYTALQKDFEIIEASSNTVTLHLGGSGPLLKSLGPQQIKVLLKLDKAVVGENNFIVSDNNVLLPPGVQLKKVEPETITLFVEGTISRQVPIQVQWSGKLPPALILSNVRLIPDTLLVTGPRNDLADLATLYTEKIPLESLTKPGTLKMEAPVILHPSTLTVTDGGKKVFVTCTVEPRAISPE